jgi:hypothetical protein
VGRADAFRAHDLARDPCLAGYQFSAGVVQFLARAAADVDAVRGMQDALAKGSPDAFSLAFSARILREHAGAFAADWPRVLEWTRSHVLPVERLGLQPPIGTKGIETRPGGGGGSSRYVFRWKWPDPRFTDECRAVICRSRPPAGASPEETASLLRIRKSRELYQSAGGYHAQQIDAAWKGAYVVVWALIDLGTDSLWSEPLVLGKV